MTFEPIDWDEFEDACVDADGNEWPEHSFGVLECKRCGAEAADYESGE
jgi:hypothetical protein